MKARNQLLILALGSNLGDREYYLRCAINGLSERVGKWLANSPVYEAVPVGVDNLHGQYLNMVVAFSSCKSPLEVLGITQDIEKQFGRESKGDLKPRTLDIDIIWYGQPVNLPQLEIPHPGFKEREFVWRPMWEVVPDFFTSPNWNGPKIMPENMDVGIRKLTCL